MVEALVLEFVPRKIVEDLDFSGLQRVNPKFHPSRRSAWRREADVIWRLPISKGSDSYIYVLIEFQSEVDPWMAVRTQVYQGLLWQQVIEEKKLKAGMPLPPLLSVVLYNGQPRWSAATTAHELIALSPDSELWSWQPRIGFYLLDMGAFSEDELAHNSGLAALLFRLERQHSPGELQTLLDEVIGWFKKHEGNERLQGLFTELIYRALARHSMSLPGTRDLLEVRSMLTIDWEGSKHEWIAKGKAEGKVEGRVEGMAVVFFILLVKRFGVLFFFWWVCF